MRGVLVAQRCTFSVSEAIYIFYVNKWSIIISMIVIIGWHLTLLLKQVYDFQNIIIFLHALLLKLFLYHPIIIIPKENLQSLIDTKNTTYSLRHKSCILKRSYFHSQQ